MWGYVQWSDVRIQWSLIRGDSETGKDRFLHLASSLSLIWTWINEISIKIQKQSDLMGRKQLSAFWEDYSLIKQTHKSKDFKIQNVILKAITNGSQFVVSKILSLDMFSKLYPFNWWWLITGLWPDGFTSDLAQPQYILQYILPSSWQRLGNSQSHNMSPEDDWDVDDWWLFLMRKIIKIIMQT